MVAVILFLKSNKIVHRDLKPANFLLKDKNIILTDFGLSKESAKSIFELNTECGSKPYMAPEIFLGVYNEKVDVYALAVILY